MRPAGRSDIGAFEYFGGLVGGLTIARNGNDAVISTEVVYGLTYRLQRKTSLTDSIWQDIPGVNDLTASDNDVEFITDPGAIQSLGRAFTASRLRTELRADVTTPTGRRFWSRPR